MAKRLSEIREAYLQTQMQIEQQFQEGLNESIQRMITIMEEIKSIKDYEEDVTKNIEEF